MNPRHKDFQSFALPTELHHLKNEGQKYVNLNSMQNGLRFIGLKDFGILDSRYPHWCHPTAISNPKICEQLFLFLGMEIELW